MNRHLCLLALAALAACSNPPLRGLSHPSTALRSELAAMAPAAPAAAASAVAAPPPAVTPRVEPPPEPRFDLIVNGAPVRDMFLSLVTDTRYSMLIHPEVAGQISVTLKGVTLREALESIREVYGFDFKVDGRRITVFPPTMQTRIFVVNYLHSQRQGRSEVRVSSGAAPVNGASGGASPAAGGASPQPESSQISTTSKNDFWAEVTEALRAMVGNTAGRSVIASPQAGTIAVRAMPDEMRQVEAFLRSTRASVERQVMLEAKIVEIELREGYQSGIDWSVLRSSAALGQASGGAGNALAANSQGLPVFPAGQVAAGIADLLSLPAAGSGTLGLAVAKNGFQALLGFLETQGDTQILSSPRVATLNNQKAVLKVGTDEYFVTNVSGGSIASATGSSSTGTTTLPTLTLTPFFSGIALDVTPQIDEADMITLHIHPSVTSVTEKTKQVDLGSIGNYRLPLASSSVNETDTVVRIPDGHIVAIGGLMQTESVRRNSGLPGSSGNAVTGTLFGNRADTVRKKELVVLIKPTIIRTADDWQQQTQQARSGLEDMDMERRRVITLDGTATAAKPSR